MKTKVKKIADILLPQFSKRRKVVKRIFKGQGSTECQALQEKVSYEYWVRNLENQLFEQDPLINIAPKISIIVPCFNTPEKYIAPLVESVLSQKYDNWELCLADGSTSVAAKTLLKEMVGTDNRIKYIDISENLGIVGNTNQGIAVASGEFIAFLDHDDVLSPYALQEVVLQLKKHPKTDLVYSDEDKLTDDGRERLLPFFKPDWSPEMLLGVNYITHFVVARKTIVDKIGGLRQGFDGAQDYDFLLRFTEQTDKIIHIPKILYHWRLADGSTAKDGGEKSYADTAGQRALKDAVKRRKIKAEVVGIPDRPTNYRLKYLLPSKQPKVSIIIPFRDKAALLKQCVGSILRKSSYGNYEIILVSNNSSEKELFDYLDELKTEKRCKLYEWNEEFNYSAINNFGRKKATGEYLIFLNNDTEVITESWIEELVGVASQNNIGAVGPLLRYPDHTIQHAGVVLGMGGMAGHVFRKLHPENWTNYGMAAWPRNYLAVTGACLAINVKKYDEVGQLDENFIIAGNDVALGIRLHEAGYRNVYWPFAELTHYENASVGSYDNVPKSDYDLSLKYYKKYLDWRDPYFNRNLDLLNEQISMRGSYE